MCQINFRIDTRSKAEMKSVFVQITHQNKQIKRSTGFKVTEKDWNNENNWEVARFKVDYRKFFFDNYNLLKESLQRSPTIDEIKTELLNVSPKETKEVENFQLTVLINKFIKSKENIYSASRISSYNRIEKLISDFIHDKPFKDDYRDVNKTWVLSFIDYLSSELEYTNSTTEQILKGIRAVMSFYDVPTRFKMKEVMNGLRGKKINNEIPFLTLEDLVSIRTNQCVLSTFEYGEVCDLFMFCAYTGLRFNESQMITEDNIIYTGEMNVLRYTTSKNGSTIEVPLNDLCVNILTSYGKALPKMSNAKANTVIHKILKDCGFTRKIKMVSYKGKQRIEELKPLHDVLSFHDSRKSFGCNLIEGGLDMQSVADLMGVDVNTLMKWYSKSNKNERNIKALNILNR